MKIMTCEMCGGHDLLKDNGVYVCQNCGCKYTVEEARKMMIEGTVDVSGSTVKIDTSEELEALYRIARRASEEGNNANAAKYYEQILIKDPRSWEAAFYTVYHQAMDCRIIEIVSAANSITNCLGNTMSLVRDVKSDEERLQAVRRIIICCLSAASGLRLGAYKAYLKYESPRAEVTSEYHRRMNASTDIVYECGIQILKAFSDNPKIIEEVDVAIGFWSQQQTIKGYSENDYYSEKKSRYKSDLNKCLNSNGEIKHSKEYEEGKRIERSAEKERLERERGELEARYLGGIVKGVGCIILGIIIFIWGLSQIGAGDTGETLVVLTSIPLVAGVFFFWGNSSVKKEINGINNRISAISSENANSKTKRSDKVDATSKKTMVTSPLNGQIGRICVGSNEYVKKGDVLAVLYAMNMENDIVAPQNGMVDRVYVNEGQLVNVGDSIAEIR